MFIKYYPTMPFTWFLSLSDTPKVEDLSYQLQILKPVYLLFFFRWLQFDLAFFKILCEKLLLLLLFFCGAR